MQGWKQRYRMQDRNGEYGVISVVQGESDSDEFWWRQRKNGRRVVNTEQCRTTNRERPATNLFGSAKVHTTRGGTL